MFSGFCYFRNVYHVYVEANTVIPHCFRLEFYHYFFFQLINVATHAGIEKPMYKKMYRHRGTQCCLMGEPSCWCVETTDACTNRRSSPIVYTLLDVKDSSFGLDDYSSDIDYESPLKRTEDCCNLYINRFDGATIHNGACSLCSYFIMPRYKTCNLQRYKICI